MWHPNAELQRMPPQLRALLVETRPVPLKAEQAHSMSISLMHRDRM